MPNNSNPGSFTLNDLESRLYGRVRSGSNRYFMSLLICGLLMLAGAAAGLQATVGGHHLFYGVTRESTWGILISTYIFFVVTSTGLCLVSSMGHVFGVESFAPIAKRAVFLSIVTLLAGFFVIAAEIKVPIRMMIYNIISPNLTSNIWWMGTLYGVALGVMLFEFFFLLINRHTLAVVCGFTAVIAELAANSNLAAVFGLLNGRGFWHGPFFPLFFIASAIMVGSAALLFFNILAYRVNGKPIDPPMERALSGIRRVGILGICILLFFSAWRFVTAFAGQPGGLYQGYMAMVAGPYAVTFWVFEVLLGMVVPLVLFLKAGPRGFKLLFLGSAVMFVGVFFMRYNMVIVGQAVHVFNGLGVNEAKHLLHYSPTWNEILVTLGGFGLSGFLFLLGEKVFAEHKVEHH